MLKEWVCARRCGVFPDRTYFTVPGEFKQVQWKTEQPLLFLDRTPPPLFIFVRSFAQLMVLSHYFHNIDFASVLLTTDFIR